MKIPWHNRAIRYKRLNGIWFEAVEQLEFIFVREVIPNLSVTNCRCKQELLSNLITKIKNCPLVVLGDDEYVSCEEIRPWKKETNDAVYSFGLNADENCIYVDYCSCIDIYDTNTESCTFFCRTMCFPRFITKHDLLAIQKNRIEILHKQIADWRILERQHDVVHVFDGINMHFKNRLCV
jgi:hypothetical protein